jgi:sensor histidine kinase YesM
MAAGRKRPAVGLSSVLRRLQEAYGDTFKITTESTPGHGFRVRLALPLHR